jgi:hypothetical protein
MLVKINVGCAGGHFPRFVSTFMVNMKWLRGKTAQVSTAILPSDRDLTIVSPWPSLAF